jgi:hypothetical protein
MSDQVDSDRVDLAEAALAIRKRLALVDEAEKPLLALVTVTESSKAAKGKVIMHPLEVAVQPTELSRCGLIRLLPKTKRRMVKNQLVECRSDIKLFFTGEELNVQDETVWLAVLRLCRGKPLGERIPFTFSRLLCELKMKDTGGKTGSRRQVLARLERLSIAHIKVELNRKGTKSLITTGLLKFGMEEETGKMYVRLDPDGKILFDNLAYQNWETRLSLKSDVAIRMLDYICGHQAGKPHAEKIENLRAWFGYTGRLDKFRVAALAGLKELEAAGVIREAGGNRSTLRWVRT